MLKNLKKRNKLHVAICTDKIEDAFFTQASYNDRYDFLHSASSKISPSYLLRNVNDEDLEYIATGISFVPIIL